MEGQECTYTQHHGIVSGHCQWTNNMTGSAICQFEGSSIGPTTQGEPIYTSGSANTG